MRLRVGSIVVLCASGALAITCLVASRPARAAEVEWKGYTWTVTNGGMAGVAAGSPANVSVDSNGYLHLQIRKNGDAWTAAEVFTTTRLGFGTYQWQVDGPIDTFDKNVVLGFFPYGPAAGIGDDGTNEIDIEYSRWGQENGPNGDWTNYPASGKTIGERSYTFSLSGGTLSTSCFIWTSTSIEDFLLAGLEPPSSTKSLLETWKYSPDNPNTAIPQQALPLGMNLWCYAIPSDGKNVEVVVRDFQFVPEGTSGGGAGGSSSGGSGGVTATAGSSALGGAGAAGAAAGGATATSGGAAATNGGSSTEVGGGGRPGGAGGASAGSAGVISGAAGSQSSGPAGHPGSNTDSPSNCSCRVGRQTRSADIQPWLFLLIVLPAAPRSRRTWRR
ncbi:MAG TPA: hypothetical protein VHM25_00030 [Polyangiaceae bacterium]|jgi:hypothetical protein|nr:hypothetical protein [Polyangiaceae bacterium]